LNGAEIMFGFDFALLRISSFDFGFSIIRLECAGSTKNRAREARPRK
jgi:hypothetical protein